ncbi:DUF3138 family protein, partial [Thiomonas sp. SCN 64-16]|uniref:DUF3138 family protein n=1 Tax=Thiomonas sp. SCN 64-16 TaxID=1660151 RepID=UPI00257E3A34
MNKFKLTVLAASLGLAPLAHADTNADILNELQALKAKVQQLEAQVKAQQTQITDNQKATDEASKVANHADVQVSGIKEQTESSGFKGLKISGMIAPAYVYNQDQQASSFVFLNRSNASAGGGTIYNYDNSYFGGAYLQFQKETAGGVGWNLTLAPDRGAGVNMNGNSIIHEASVSIPLNNETKLIAGQIPDWEGYEYTWDNQTKPITHNLLFDFTELTAYTGVGLDQTVGNWEWKSMIANMNSPRYYYGGFGGPGRVTPSWSMTKSMTATTIARLLHKGWLRSVYDRAPAPLWADPRGVHAAITIDDLLRMRSGLALPVLQADGTVTLGFENSMVYQDAGDAFAAGQATPSAAARDQLKA